MNPWCVSQANSDIYSHTSSENMEKQTVGICFYSSAQGCLEVNHRHETNIVFFNVTSDLSNAEIIKAKREKSTVSSFFLLFADHWENLSLYCFFIVGCSALSTRLLRVNERRPDRLPAVASNRLWAFGAGLVATLASAQAHTWSNIAKQRHEQAAVVPVFGGLSVKVRLLTVTLKWQGLCIYSAWDAVNMKNIQNCHRLRLRERKNSLECVCRT